MIIQKITPELMVFDVSESIRFYEQVLGFNTIAREGTGQHLTWALLEQGNFQLSLKDTSHAQQDLDYLTGRSLGGSSPCVLL